jgi:H/ACA ribonucleoprotein complex non-core subunit NAF1
MDGTFQNDPDDINRPSKKVRRESPRIKSPELDGDLDDSSLYGSPPADEGASSTGQNFTNDENASKKSLSLQPEIVSETSAPASTSKTSPAIPGLGLSEASDAVYYEAPTPTKPATVSTSTSEEIPIQSIEHDSPGGSTKNNTGPHISIDKNIITKAVEANSEQLVKSKPPPDPEFLAAATATKGDPSAEWQYDSSDAESSSDDSSSSSSGGSDDEYELLDPVAQAKILMAEGDSDDEGGSKSKASKGQMPRTTNEVAEELVVKPEIVIYEHMHIESLGAVETVVDTLVLIKGDASGDYRVLEQGSLLCLGDRNVIGVVGETLGRVQQPLYTVRFNDPAEISENGVFVGTQIFYVPQHSTFVFTQQLRGLRGTDASNIHDEEVADHEIEFSDDEAEEAYKRAQKQARKEKAASRNGSVSMGPPRSDEFRQRGGRGGRGGARNVRGRDSRGNTSISRESSVLSYDEPDHDDHYTPLARPSNFQDLMQQPPVGNSRRSHTPGDDRHPGHQARTSQGSSNSYQDRQYGLPRQTSDNSAFSPSSVSQSPVMSRGYSVPRPSSTGFTMSSPNLTPMQAAMQTMQFSPQNSPPPLSNPAYPFPQPSTQMSGWFGTSNAQPPMAKTHTTLSPSYPGASYNFNGGFPSIPPGLPSGAFINPAFAQPTPQNNPSGLSLQTEFRSATGPSTPNSSVPADAEAAFRAAQEKLDILKNLSWKKG